MRKSNDEIREIKYSVVLSTENDKVRRMMMSWTVSDEEVDCKVREIAIIKLEESKLVKFD